MQYSLIKTFAFSTFIAAATLLTGCSTYINVPALPGDVAVNDPNDETVIKVIVAAIPYAVQDQGYKGTYQVQFPVGTKSIVAYDALNPIDDKALWRNPVNPELPVYQAAQVRVRSWVAEVDVVRPVNPNQLNLGTQLVTVFLKWDAVTGWTGKRLRVWTITVDDALRKAPYSSDLSDSAAPSSKQNAKPNATSTKRGDNEVPPSSEVPGRYE
jgi:hypothetical protein